MGHTNSQQIVWSYEFIKIELHEKKETTKNTHVMIVVVLPRRNDPFLELFLVGHSSGEELLQRQNRPSQLTILHVKCLRTCIHTHS